MSLHQWQTLIGSRQEQMDAAYAALRRTSGDFWDRRADRFRAASARLAEDDVGLRLLHRLTTAESTVLDVGAGAGRYALAIAPRVRRVVAVEPNGALAGHLRTDAAARGLRNIDVIESPWEAAEVPPADVVLCAHVLNPIYDAEPFVRKLDAHAERACLVLAMASWSEPPALLDLWQRFHGAARVRQPDARHVFDLLYDLGYLPNVEIGTATTSSWQFRFASLREAVAAAREHVILPEDPATDAALAAALGEALVTEADGSLSLPAPPRIPAALWWTAASPRLHRDT